MRIKTQRAKSKEQRLLSNKDVDDNRASRSGDLRVSFSVAVFLLSSVFVNAQCAMCRAALESEGDMAKGEAVNDGIVYLMAIPYLLVAIVGFYIYKTRFKKD